MKNSNIEAVIRVATAGYDTYNGEIVDMQPGVSVTVRYKQPRRPKLSLKQIVWSDVLVVSGDIGEVGYVLAKSGSVPIISGKGQFDNITEKYATAIVNDAKLTVNVSNVQIESFVDKLEDGDIPAKKPSKAKGANKVGGKKAGGKLKKKKK